MHARFAAAPVDEPLAALRVDLSARNELQETIGSPLDDWVGAFAARLAWFGVPDDRDEIVTLGRSLYEHYGLLDPYDIARRVWRRWPKERRAVRRHTLP